MNEMELSLYELEQVNGGWTWCFIIGASNEPEAQACYTEGHNTKEDFEALGFTACAIIGAGIGINYSYDSRPL